MTRAESAKHVVEIVAGVAVIASVGLGVVAKDATEAKAAAQTAVVEVQSSKTDLQVELEKAEADNADLRAQVDDLRRQLGAADPGVASAASGPAPGAVLYSGRILKMADTCNVVFLDFDAGKSLVEKVKGVDAKTAMCGSELWVADYSDYVFTTEVGDVATHDECRAGVDAAPVTQIPLEEAKAFCAVNEETAAHVVVLKYKDGVGVTYRVTAWARG